MTNFKISTHEQKFSDSMKNIVRKGENDDYQHFLLLPQGVQRDSSSRSLKSDPLIKCQRAAIAPMTQYDCIMFDLVNNISGLHLKLQWKHEKKKKIRNEKFVNLKRKL